MRELNVSKSAFDFGWMATIEDTGRHDCTSHYADAAHQELASLSASTNLPRKSATAGG
jgi:hypothetical protein